jgi:hypothetical protein
VNDDKTAAGFEECPQSIAKERVFCGHDDPGPSIRGSIHDCALLGWLLSTQVLKYTASPAEFESLWIFAVLRMKSAAKAALFRRRTDDQFTMIEGLVAATV